MEDFPELGGARLQQSAKPRDIGWHYSMGRGRLVDFFKKAQDLDFVVFDPVMPEGEDSAAFMGLLLCGDECMYDLLQEESVWPQHVNQPTIAIFDSDSDSDLFI